MPTRKLTIGDLFAVSTIMGIRLSPDGAHAVVTVRKANEKDQRNESRLWLWTAEDGSFRKLTKGPADGGAVWLDNRTVLFSASKRAQDEEKVDKVQPHSRLYTIRIDGGEPELRATLDGVLWDYEPDPKGRRLALVFCPNPKASKEQLAVWEKAPKPLNPKSPYFKMDGIGLLPEARAGIYVLDCRGEEWTGPKRIAQDEVFGYSHPRWTPDGKGLVAMRHAGDRPFQPTDIVLMGMTGRQAVLNAPKGFVASFAISPDGKRLAFAANEHTTYGGSFPVPLGVRSMDPRDRKFRITHTSDGRFGNCDVLSDITPAGDGRYLSWADNERVVALLAEHGTSRLVEANMAKPGELATVAGGTGVVTYFDQRGDTMLYAWADPTHVGEVYHRGVEEPVSAINVKAGKPYTLRPERWFVKSAPGVKVDTWLYATPEQLATRRRASLPLVIYVHGGPNTEAGECPFHEYAWLAQQGFPTIISNPRGSTGYGEKHGPAINGNWGDRDVHDILAVREDTLKRHPQFDPRRTFIVGGSYGGYMANMMVTRHPGVFRAGIAERSICNFISFDMTGDFPQVFARLAVGLDNVFQNIDRAWKLSPVSRAMDVRDPLLIIHSDNDLRCPLSQAEEMANALMATGRKWGEDFRVHIFRGESHGLSRGGRPENRRVRLELILGWLKQHNTPRPAARGRKGGRK